MSNWNKNLKIINLSITYVEEDHWTPVLVVFILQGMKAQDK